MKNPNDVILVVDIGNTRTKYFLRRLHNDGSSSSIGRMLWHPTDHGNCTPGTPVNPAADPERLSREILRTFARAIPVVVASVVPYATRRLKEACAGRKFLEVTAATAGPLSNIHPELGVDILAAATAAYQQYGKTCPMVVLGLGTATTIAVISKTGSFVSVNIGPGLTMMIDSVAKGCALLDDVDPNSVLGKAEGFLRDKGFKLSRHAAPSYIYELGGNTTPEAVRRGTFPMFIDGVRGLVKLGKRKAGRSAIVVATGGWSQLVSEHLPTIHHVDPELTAKGICILARSLL